jgi:hypothetical protein
MESVLEEEGTFGETSEFDDFQDCMDASSLEETSKVDDFRNACPTVTDTRFDSDPERICRICLEPEGGSAELGLLISPCLCRGSMRFVHRACLDEWRMSCFNPKALMECTTCRTPFRIRYEGPEQLSSLSGRSWWVRFAVDVLVFVGLRLGAFLAAACALGFWPQLLVGAGAGLLHQNPVFNHMLYGMGSVLALFGTYVFLNIPGAWHLDASFRFLIEAWCPHRGNKTSIEAAIGLLVIVGLICVLWILIKGIFSMLREGGHELAKATRSANQQARRRIVEQYVVLNFDEKVDMSGEHDSAQDRNTPCTFHAPLKT